MQWILIILMASDYGGGGRGVGAATFNTKKACNDALLAVRGLQIDIAETEIMGVCMPAGRDEKI